MKYYWFVIDAEINSNYWRACRNTRTYRRKIANEQHGEKPHFNLCVHWVCYRPQWYTRFNQDKLEFNSSAYAYNSRVAEQKNMRSRWNISIVQINVLIINIYTVYIEIYARIKHFLFAFFFFSVFLSAERLESGRRRKSTGKLEHRIMTDYIRIDLHL